MFRTLYLSYLQLNYPDYRMADTDVVMAAVMKRLSLRIISRMLLVAYALMMCKPAMPVVMDALAHTFWRTAHLKVIHRVNGKEHVHYELCKAAKDGDQHKTNGKAKFEHTDEANIVVIAPILFRASSFCVRIYPDPPQLIPDAYAVPDFLPPKA